MNHVLIAAAIILSFGQSWASDNATPSRGKQSRLWNKIADGQYRKFLDHMEEADFLARTAARLFDEGETPAAMSRALLAADAYETASKLRPLEAEPHYRAAEVLWARFGEGDNDLRPQSKPTLRAIGHWQAFEKLAPNDPRLAQVYFRRALALTKLGGDENILLAISDYKKHLKILDGGMYAEDARSIALSNLAELCMYVGDLTGAINNYYAAMAIRDRALYGYGLAVALDRDGQAAKARQVMSSYARSDRLRELSDEGVFFVPHGDNFYYLGLGFEVLGQTGSAINYYSRYVTELPQGRYRSTAENNIRSLQKKPVAKPK